MSFIFLRQYLTPVINNAKDNITDDVKNELKFKRLHLLSVVINFFQIIFCIVLLLNIIQGGTWADRPYALLQEK